MQKSTGIFHRNRENNPKIDMEPQRKREKSQFSLNVMLMDIYKKIKIKQSDIDKAYNDIAQTKQNTQTLNNQKKEGR